MLLYITHAVIYYPCCSISPIALYNTPYCSVSPTPLCITPCCSILSHAALLPTPFYITRCSILPMLFYITHTALNDLSALYISPRSSILSHSALYFHTHTPLCITSRCTISTHTLSLALIHTIVRCNMKVCVLSL